MNINNAQENLVKEVKLDTLQAKVFVTLVSNGKMRPDRIGEMLDADGQEVREACRRLVDLGGVIELNEDEFECMHPRFAVVNMYKRMCQRQGVEFKKNTMVDNIGVALEPLFDNARTK